MTLGKLNLLLDSTLRITFENSTLSPAAAETGNPLKGEKLLLPWSAVRDIGTTLHITLAKRCFVDRAVLRLGENTALTALSLVADGTPVSTYHAETGKTITSQEIELQAGVTTETLAVTVTGYFSDIELLSLDLYGSLCDAPALFPTPNCVEFGTALLPHSLFNSYSADSADGLRAAAVLAEKYAERTGISPAAAEKAAIRFVTDPSIPADGYELTVNETGAHIAASNFRGAVMGAECFIKLTDHAGVYECTISDSPAMPFRGVHLYLPAEKSYDFAKRFIKYVVSPMGYNVVILEVAAGMLYESHPEINTAVQDALEKHKQGIWPNFPHGSVAEGEPIGKELIRDYVAYIRSFGIEVVPEVQSLGHVPFMTHTYPEIAEIPSIMDTDSVDTRNEDALPEMFYPHCYCPSNERSYEILFDLLDEIIQVFEPKEYVHMGHDEVYYIGHCPKCREKDPADLFASDVNRIYNHLAEKGLKMMIWADMLQPSSPYLTPPAIDKIPKDILLLDFIWYFHLGKDIEDDLLKKGFKVAFGNLYSSHFPRYESRIAKKGIIGGQISAWTPTNESSLQREGKLYDFLFTAQMLWSKDYTHCYTLTYDSMIATLTPHLRENLRGLRYPSLHGGTETLLYKNDISFPPAVRPAPVSFTVDAHFDSLILCHTALNKRTRMPWTPNTVLGHYLLRFDDGSTEEIPITNNGNIGHWNRRPSQILPHPLYRHNGYTSAYLTDAELSFTSAGEPVTLYRLEHLLPTGKKLLSVTLEEEPTQEAGILLCRAEGITLE